MERNALAPIIIKKKKIVKGGGHHGGAWKVAYADFVTAMMAFFLLMWLLNATSEKQRKGLADYFSPTIPINRISAGGDGSMWGDSVFADDSMAQNGTFPSSPVPMEIQSLSGDKGSGLDPSAEISGEGTGSAASEQLLENLKARGGESMAELLKQRHVVTKVTDEGLVIEVMDLPGQPLFFGLSDQPTRHYMDTLETIARVVDLVQNRVAVNGHMAAQPLVARTNPVWDVSAARADATRRLLQADLSEPKRLHRVTGYADRDPSADNPMSPLNNRVEIVLLRDGL